jgi:protein arginine N-methyltransferase 5
MFDLQTGMDSFVGVIHTALALPYTQCLIRVRANNWDEWNSLRMICGHHPKLGVVLRIEESGIDDNSLAAWISEPIKILNLPSHIFLKNKAGYPVLSKSIQKFYHQLLDSEVKILISATIRSDLNQFAEYLVFLQSSKPPSSVIDQFAVGYHNSLQTPLQVP